MASTSPAPTTSADSPVVLLTRDIHQHGPWLTDLYDALKRKGVPIIILPLSEWHGTEKGWRLLVNRVSDAAPPQDVKLTLAALRSAELAGVPTLNGVASYSMATSKLLHYELFQALGLVTPPYVAVRDMTGPQQLLTLARNANLTFPLLLKPNAGGFGNGIVRLESAADIPGLFETAAAVAGGVGGAGAGEGHGVGEDGIGPAAKRVKTDGDGDGGSGGGGGGGAIYERSSTTQAPAVAATTAMCGKTPSTGEYVAPLTTHRAGEALAGALGDDGVALLQECAPPDGGFTYRVFFQGDVIQCGVKVQAVSFNACVRSVPHKAWPVPTDIQAHVHAMRVKAEADCGSVEFLYKDGVPNYFDFNILSTLPTAHGAGLTVNPYDDLANFMLKKCVRLNEI